jgi:hypothetical protein
MKTPNPADAVKKAQEEVARVLEDRRSSINYDAECIRLELCLALPPCPFCGQQPVPSAWGWMENGVMCPGPKDRCTLSAIWMPGAEWAQCWNSHDPS